MKRSILLSILIPLLLVVALNMDIIVEELTVREYRVITRCVIENTGFTEIGVNPSDIVNFYLIPNISGWQYVEEVLVYINGKLADKNKYYIDEVDGNKLLKFHSPFRLDVGGKLNVTLVQKVVVYRLVFSGVKRVPRGLKGGLKEPMPTEDYLMLKGFYRKGDFSKVVETAEKMEGSGFDVLLNILKFICSRIKYSNSSYGIAPPAETLERGYGSCGDISALTVALLRLKEIPAFIYFCYVYEEGLNFYEKSPILTINYSNIGPHAFAMAYLESVGWVPIDMVIHAGNRPIDCIEGAGVNINDRIIVYAKAVKLDPNILLVIAPQSKTKVYVEYRAEVLPKKLDIIRVLYSLMLALLTGYIVYLAVEELEEYGEQT